MSATAQKVIATAMALLPFDLSSLTVSFPFAAFCKAVGFGDGGEQYSLFKTAVDECMGNYIAIEIINTDTGKREWQRFNWFTWAKVDEKSRTATMIFSPQLATALLELKKTYSRVNLKDIGGLQSRYALRIFQLIVSYVSLKGKDGNQEMTWYCEREIEELRFMFGVPKGTYKDKHLFRQKVIDGPVKEINRAGLGIEVSTIGVKKGRYLAAIRFACRQVPPIALTKQGAAAALPEPDPRAEQDREEKELQHLKELYPDEFAELYATALENTPAFIKGMEFGRMTAAAEALLKLREKYGIVK
jgi:plasmid replication initiation protein